MKDIVSLNKLYEIYKNLLTTKQQNYYEDYYFNDMSLAEIAENYGVSRNAVYNQVNNTRILLQDYEAKLKFCEKYEKILNISEDKEKIEEIIW